MKKFFNRSHCDLVCRDYTGQVLVLAPHVLRKRGLSHDEQLFFAEAGCGCSPAMHGHKVFGQFLKSAESAQFHRKDFLGVLKEEFLPQWAECRVAEIEKEDIFLLIT